MTRRMFRGDDAPRLRRRFQAAVFFGMRLLLGAVLSFGFFCAPARAAQPVPFSLSIDGQSLVAANSRSGDTIVFFGDAIENRGNYPGSFHAVRTAVSSSAGQTRMDLGRKIARQSIWIAVDLDSGDVASISPPGFSALPVNIDFNAWSRRPDGTVAAMVLPFPISDVLLVRPRQGAWYITLSDGGPRDADGQRNGVTIGAVEQLTEMKKNVKAPEFLRGNDVVVAIDPLSLRYFILKVKP